MNLHQRYNFSKDLPAETLRKFLNTPADLQQSETGQLVKNLMVENAQLRKMLEDKSRKVNDLIEHNHRVVSIIAHDLRSPFNALLSVLDILKKVGTQINKDVLNSYIEILYNTSTSSLDLLDDLLEWVVVNNSGKFNPSKMNLSEVLDEVINLLSSLAGTKSVNIVNGIDKKLSIVADKNMVTTIFRNLISNAILYNKEKGEVRIIAKMNENHVLVEVKDTGKGIKSEYLTNIFNSKMNESSETKEERWKGLGLLFCKDFVEIHGGNITIDSEEGKGTSIKFTLKQF